MIKSCLATLLFIGTSLSIHAQDTVPVLKGKMSVSVTRGTIQCDFTLSNIPNIKDYYIRLNSGMNIRYIKSGNGLGALSYDKSLKDTLATGEANAYYIGAYTDNGKYLPRAVHMNYVGQYPVIADSIAAGDWKGNIAFNGHTLRTDGSQTAWYPILYDIKKDLLYDKVLYDIELDCADCKTLYINGSNPVTGTHARFKSDQPQELTMFLGNYDMAAKNGTYFLNADMDEQEVTNFEATIHTYKDYYEKHLQIPYKGTAVFIQTTPVSKYNSWLFATYPTIVNIGWGENGIKTFGNDRKPYMAHELGHYYFGKSRTFNSGLGDMIQEGFSEFLSMHITRKLISDSIFQAKLATKTRAMGNDTLIPFASIRSHSEYKDRELYVYYYAPLIFTAIEKEIGEPAMWKWMRSLLQTPAPFTNYQFLEQTLADVLKDNTKMDGIRSKYFTTNKVMDNVKATLGLSSGPSGSTASADPNATKTYYYFIFTRPIVDAGAPENHVVKHSGIGTFTGTAAELSKKIRMPLYERFKAACENEAGCTSDFNTYNDMETAKAALVRWLKPYTSNPAFVIKEMGL